MLKKAVIVAGAAALLLGLFFGRDACSYVSTGWRQVHGTVHDNIPVSFQIKRAEEMIKGLDSEIVKNSTIVVREEVAVDRLRRDVARGEKELAKGKEDILRLTSDLSRGDSNFVYAGRSFTEKQVKSDLEHRFSRYQTSEATVAKLQQILEARQKGLFAANEKLEAMKAQKRQLEVDVENLKARLKMVEVAQTTSNFNLDESRLSRTRALIDEIQTRIEVAEKTVGADIMVHGEIPLDTADEGADITQKVTDYFGGQAERDVLAKAAK